MFGKGGKWRESEGSGGVLEKLGCVGLGSWGKGNRGV